MKCKDCFFTYLGEKGIECRRFPPQIVVRKDRNNPHQTLETRTSVEYPPVEDDMFCGEYRLDIRKINVRIN